MTKASSASVLLFLHLVFLFLSITCRPAAGAASSCTPPPCHGKQSWPELVGKDQNTAYNAIKHDNPEVTDVVYLISAWVSDVLGAAGDDDFCCNRVVVVLGPLPSGEDGVIKVPRVG
ncbi:hypothetical protein ACP70R_035490 [Stipagrostis hirtigluma subsp. patula]